jgi:1-aminocyclopropane-1-carboxylate deaminase/D-cysteine desulfhydrase-like pyridoxal-dependent ACC family enzyme
MGRKTRKLNFLIEESICHELETLVTTGNRSKVVNEALRKELELIRRKNAVENIHNASSKGKRFSSIEIVDKLAKDRRAH